MLKLVEVESSHEIKSFLSIADQIYKDDPEWIKPLDKDIEAVFDREKNKYFRHGDCIRYNVYQGNKHVGRFAVFYNKKQKLKLQAGGIGFFECVNDQKVANFIFDTAKDWLLSHGYEAMDGLINFGERDKFWGLLVEGFHEPLYGMNYNPPYYVDLLENYGFKVYFNQLCYGLKVKGNFKESWLERSKTLAADPDYTIKNVSKRNLEKFARDFTYIYNKAWVTHAGNKTLDEKVAVKMFQTMKPVMDEKISMFVYHKDQPVACWINLPDLNQYFKYLNGKLSLWHKIKFLYYKKTLKNNRMVGLVFGVIPEYQGRGIDNFMMIESNKDFVNNTHYEDYEMQWIGDFNPKMINIAKSLGAEVTRKLATYRKIFDDQEPFERYPIIK